MSAYSTDCTQLRDRYEAQQQELDVAQGDLESLKRDLDMVRAERDNAQQEVQRSAAAQPQADAVKLNNFIGALPPLLSIATGLRGLQSTPPTFANAVRSAVPASFEVPPPGSLQFLALVPVILAATVLTSPQVPDLEDLAGVLRQAVAAPSPVTTPEARVDAPELSFAIPAPVPKPRAAAPLRAPGAPLQPPSPTPSPTDAALASLLEWIPEIPKGFEDEVAHTFHLQLFRHYGASVSSRIGNPAIPDSGSVDLGPQPRAQPARHRRCPAHLPRQPSPCQTGHGQSSRLPGRSRSRQPGRGRGQEEGVDAPESGARDLLRALWVGWQGWTTPHRGKWTRGSSEASSATNLAPAYRPSRTSSSTTRPSLRLSSSPPITTRA